MLVVLLSQYPGKEAYLQGSILNFTINKNPWHPRKTIHVQIALKPVPLVTVDDHDDGVIIAHDDVVIIANVLGNEE